MTKPNRFREIVKLVKFKTNDGLFEMLEDKTFIGKGYYVDPTSRKMQNVYVSHEQLSYMIEIIEVWDNTLEKSSILPMELLDI